MGAGTISRPTAATAEQSRRVASAPRSASAIYEGTVFHRRREPVAHGFAYRIFMPLFDLAELPELLDPYPLWSARPGRRRLGAHFRAGDYLDSRGRPLAEAARDLVAERTGRRPGGPVRLLAHPRWWGLAANPVVFFYLHGSEPGAGVEAIVAEVTNTPWGERRRYVLEPGADGLRGSFAKRMHVSPFMPMEQTYEWEADEPGETLRLRIANRERGRIVFEAGIELRRREITTPLMRRLLVSHPPMTAATLARIYLQAARLKLKGAPYHRKPAATG